MKKTLHVMVFFFILNTPVFADTYKCYLDLHTPPDFSKSSETSVSDSGSIKIDTNCDRDSYDGECYARITDLYSLKPVVTNEYLISDRFSRYMGRVKVDMKESDFWLGNLPALKVMVEVYERDNDKYYFMSSGSSSIKTGTSNIFVSTGVATKKGGALYNSHSISFWITCTRD